MKIGIITLSASYNCGSMLQSYALKELLSSYGDVEIINFSSEASHRQYDVIPHSFLGKLRLGYRHRGLLDKLKYEVKSYINFQKNFLNITGKEYWAKDLYEIKDKYDVVVAGSDQVWNVCMGDFDEAFFCGWTDAKKIAYAPSLGGCDIRKSSNCQNIIEAIKSFSSLSVRESVGKKCLDEILNKNVEKVLDPTLVLNIAEWKKLAREKKVEGEYIFFYSWAYCSEETRNIVKKRSKETNLPVYVIDAHKWRTHSYKDDGFVLYEEAGPLAFLNLMAHAKECYVESFHGMLFAYMFKRNFWLLDTHEKYEELDARLKELVELVGAKDRLVTKYNYDKINFSQDFKYIENPLLNELQQTSKDYLEKAFDKL